MHELTQRERDVLEVLARDGASNHDIGREMFLEIATVKGHLGSAMRKLQARNRTELALKYTRQRETQDA